jgi:putative membrane protein
MYWYDHDMGGWGWFAMSFGTLLLWTLLITVAVLLIRTFKQSPRSTDAPPSSPAEKLLAERFARGEIDEDEYRRRLDVLKAGSRLNKS